MSEDTQRWSVCPIEDCEYSQEYDPDAAAFCPDCGMELISECPSCKKPIMSADQISCSDCGTGFKE